MILTSNRIRELRKKKHLTLQQLSKLTGISVSSLSAYEKEKGEKGYRSPKIEKWRRLANALDVTLPYLQGESYDEILENKKYFKSLEKFLNDIPKKKKISKDNEEIIYEIELFWKYLISVGKRDDIPEFFSDVDFISEYLSSLFLLTASMVGEIETGFELSNYLFNHSIEIPKSKFNELTPDELISLPGELELLSVKFYKDGEKAQKKLETAKKLVKEWHKDPE